MPSGSIARGRLVLLALLLCACGGSDHRAPGEKRIVEIDSGHLLLDDPPERPPAASADWQPVTLPDAWRSRRPEFGGTAWYRFEVAVDSRPGERLGVLLPVTPQNAEVWVDGTRLGAAADFDTPNFQNWPWPLYQRFSPTFWSHDPGRDPELGASRPLVVHVRVRTIAWALDHLSPIYVGPDRALEARYHARLLREVRVPQLATGICAALVVFIGLIWLGTGRAVYGWYVGIAFFWMIASLNFHLRHHPVSFWPWQVIANVSLDLCAASVVMTTHRLMELDRRGVERGLAAFCVAALLIPIALPYAYYFYAAHAFHVASLGWAAYMLVAFARRGTLIPGERLLVIPAGAAIMALCAHDLLIQTGLLAPDRLRMMHLGVPAILATFGGSLITRFLHAYRLAERQNVELERRVAEKHAELEQNFERVRALERERAVGTERERLMREMHDGMGAQLVSTLGMVESGGRGDPAVAQALRAALDEMRLVIQSLDPLVDDVPALLGTLRAALEPRIAQQGVRLDWKVGDLPELPNLRAGDRLHVLRIVQEAISNALKHARPEALTLAAGVEAGLPYVRVRDDGSGLPTDPRPGRGLENMRWRARELGGRLEISAAAPGTAVTLWLPLEPEFSRPSG